jgi:hypothetical protein
LHPHPVRFCGTRHLLPDGSPGRLGSSLGAATSLTGPVLWYRFRTCAAYQQSLQSY